MKKYKDKNWLTKKYYNEKMTLKEMGKLCEVGYSIIGKWMDKFNLKRRNASESHIDFIDTFINEEWFIENYVKNQMTVKEISEKYKISEGKIRFRLNKFNIIIRNPSETQLLTNKKKIKKYDDKKWLFKEYQKKSIKQIADECRVSICTIGNWLMFFNIIKRKKKIYTKIEDSQIKKYHILFQEYITNLFTIKEISEKYNVSERKIRKQLTNFNIPIRISYSILKQNLKLKNVDCNYLTRILSVYTKNFWRPQIFFRDNYYCQKCKSKVDLNAHHIIPFSFIRNSILKELDKQLININDILDDYRINDLDNGVTLCKECHVKYHKSFGVKIKGCLDEIIIDKIENKYSFFGRIKTGINFLNKEHFKIFGTLNDINIISRLQKGVIKAFTIDKKNGVRLAVLNG